MFQWKKFAFFEKAIVKEEGQTQPHAGIEAIDVTCVSSGRGRILFGDSTGSIRFLSRNFTLTAFQAFQTAVTLVHQCKQRNFLVAVGDDGEGVNQGTIKIWNLENDEPDLVKTIKIFNTKQTSPLPSVTALDASEDLSLVAVGLSDGRIHLFRGDLAREKVTKAGKCIFGPGATVTNIGLRKIPGAEYALLVSTTDEVHSIRISSRGESDEVLDMRGCPLGLSTITDDRDIAVGQREAVFFFGAEGRGPCFAFEGEKTKLGWFRSYLVVIGKDAQDPRRSSVNVYDLRNKLIAFSGIFGPVKHVVSEWGSIFLVIDDFKPDGTTVQRMVQLEEKDIQTKLDTLFRKNLYQIAVNLAQSSNLDDAFVADIFRKFGDHSYSKGDYDQAVSQYIRTIGRLEPSYVIRKFLDAQRIHNLTRYLEELHTKSKATADHTTLLINCYTKLKDVAKLDAFIKRNSELHYDVDTAIRVCRQASYHEHALFLALKHNEHDWCMKILLDDLKQYSDALEFLSTLEFAYCETFMKQYGTLLCTAVPKNAREFLQVLCTDYKPKSRKSFAQAPSAPEKEREEKEPHQQAATAPAVGKSDPQLQQQPKDSTSISLGKKMNGIFRNIMYRVSRDKDDDPKPAEREREKPREDASVAKQNALAAEEIKKNSPSQTVQPVRKDQQSGSEVHSLAELLQPAKSEESTPTASASARDKLFSAPRAKPSSAALLSGDDVPSTPPIPTLQRANAEDFLHCFVDQPKELIAFLEFVVSRVPKCSQRIFHTMLEVYLKEDAVSDAAFNNPDTTKSMKLLKSDSANYDPQHALMLVQESGFRPATLFLYTQMQLYHDILQLYMDENDAENVVKTCEAYAASDPNMWIQVLAYFADLSSNHPDADYSGNIRRMLDSIDKGGMLPPLSVLQVLSRSNALTLASVKDYLMQLLAKEQASISDDEAAISKFREETRKMKQEIDDLRTSARIFQQSKCTGCGSTLDLPAVHFMCMHSFHLHCMGDNESECPICAPGNRRFLDIRRQHENAAYQHEQFFKNLEQSKDGFRTIAEYFGRGIFRPRLQVGRNSEDLDSLSMEERRARLGL
eukprot:ANDGO_04909.mRNA.1 Vacuolar protein sorting-associated protein 11 homolog